MSEIKSCSSRVIPDERYCDTCVRKEHKHSKDGICHFCWGSGVRSLEGGTELSPCIYCVAMYPQPQPFCIHGGWWSKCQTCMDEMREITKDYLTMDITKHALFVMRTQRRRLDD